MVQERAPSLGRRGSDRDVLLCDGLLDVVGGKGPPNCPNLVDCSNIPVMAN